MKLLGRLFLLSLALAIGALTTRIAHAQGRSFVDLGVLPGFSSSEAFGISATGQVCGDSWIPLQGLEGSTRAFLWDPSSGMRDLGSLPGYGSSHACGMNDRS